MKKLENLSFVIGLFFGIIGSLLILAGILGDENNANGFLNYFTGAAALAFAALMIFLSGRSEIKS